MSAESFPNGWLPSLTPTGRISKARKSKRIHACSFPGCGKVFTRAEHRRRHELNHNPEALFRCTRPGCTKAFHRLDLLQRHQERHELEDSAQIDTELHNSDLSYGPSIASFRQLPLSAYSFEGGSCAPLSTFEGGNQPTSDSWPLSPFDIQNHVSHQSDEKSAETSRHTPLSQLSFQGSYYGTQMTYSSPEGTMNFRSQKSPDAENERADVLWTPFHSLATGSQAEKLESGEAEGVHRRSHPRHDISAIIEDDKPRVEIHSNHPRTFEGVPPTDSGYASMSHERFNRLQHAQAEEKTESVETRQFRTLSEPEIGSTINVAEDLQSQQEQDSSEIRTVYSDTSSAVSPARECYKSELADELFSKVLSEQPDVETVQRITKILPDLLKAFALKVGYNAPTQMHRDVMVFVHQHRSDIAEYFEDSYVQMEESLLDSTTSAHDKMASKDMIMRWFENWEYPPDNPLGAGSDHSDNAEDDDFTNQEFDEEEEDITTVHLAAYRDFLNDSPAFEWLLARLRRELLLAPTEPNVMETIGQRILEALPISHKVTRKKSAAAYKMNFRMRWDPVAFTKDQEYGDDLAEVVDKVITLTGSAREAQALPCVQYLSQVWPTTSGHMIRLLKATMHGGLGRRHTCVLPDYTKVTLGMDESGFIAIVLGTRDTIAEIGQQLAWLGAALRTSPYEQGVAYCTPFIAAIGINGTPIPTSESLSEPEIHCYIDYTVQKREDDPESSNGQCWHNLFRNPIIVEGYPIPRRSEQNNGLEISLHMMAGLANTKHVNTFNNQIFIKGFSTMLVPTRYNDQQLTWHLLYKENGDRISYLDSDVTHTEKVCVSGLENSRHILGWCSEARYMAGAKDAEFFINWSGLRGPHSGCKLENVSICHGRLITGVEKYAIGNKDRPHRIMRDDYPAKLSWISRKYVVLWDVDDKRGWLVNGSSALLHLLRTSLESNNSDELKSAFIFKPEELKEASVPYTTSSAAEILLSPPNLDLKLYLKDTNILYDRSGTGTLQSAQTTEPTEKYVRLRDRIERLYSILEKIIDHQISMVGRNGKELMSTSRKHLEGWDFKDLATNEDPLYPRVCTLKTAAKGWVDFTRAIHAVTLFGSGFGEIIEPIDANNKCLYRATLPREKFYLAASMSDLRQIMDRFGNPRAQPMRLTDHIIWHYLGETFNPCQCANMEHTKHSNLAQVLLPSRFRKKIPKTSPVQLEDRGAVIFGHNVDFAWFWNDIGDPEHRVLPSSEEESDSDFNDSGLGQSLGQSTAAHSNELDGDLASGSTTKALTHEDYKVGIVCALHKELLAVRALFECTHPNLEIVDQDTNHYALGRLEDYNVVAACLPCDDYGTNSATSVASHMIRSFPAVKFFLVVGIGGGVPSKENEIHLGDVVVGTGILQFDMGKAFQNTGFKTTGLIQRPPSFLGTAISEIRSDPLLSPDPLGEYIQRIEAFRPEYQFPGREHDKLFEPQYAHGPIQGNCVQCDGPQVQRKPRSRDSPRVFYGLIASGNQVVKDAQVRDRLYADTPVLCFEMEAAGVMKTEKCLVIRGICDYADSHKTKLWQEYAAATAAAFASFFLSRLRNLGVLSQRESQSEGIGKLMVQKRTASYLEYHHTSPSKRLRQSHLVD